MTKECLHVALKIMTSTDDKSIKIGYNSPGALASVNHLHLHLLHLEHELYVEDVVSFWHIFIKMPSYRQIFIHRS